MADPTDLDAGFVWTTVLVESDRTIRRYRTDALERRVVCQLKRDIDGGKSFLDLAFGRRREPYPEC